MLTLEAESLSRNCKRSLSNVDAILLGVLCISKGKGKGKGKAVLLQAWSGPEGSRELRFPDFMTTAQDNGKVVTPTHQPPLPPGNARCTHFC